ncbi:MAG: hypothetical protein AAFR75_10445, partial [Pseudomonadota bacterium]
MNVHNRDISEQDAVTPDSKVVETHVSQGAPGETLDVGAEQVQSAVMPRTWGGFSLLIGRYLTKLILPLLVLAGGYAGYEYFVATKPEPPRKPQLERAFNVRTTTVRIGNVQPTLEVFGSTVAGREVDIRALVAGRIMGTADQLREGGTVPKDTTLLNIDPMDYKT